MCGYKLHWRKIYSLCKVDHRIPLSPLHSSDDLICHFRSNSVRQKWRYKEIRFFFDFINGRIDEISLMFITGKLWIEWSICLFILIYSHPAINLKSVHIYLNMHKCILIHISMCKYILIYTSMSKCILI